MDPEIFLLSTATLGWKLSVWRLVATFIISLSSGYFTHFIIRKGTKNEIVLRNTTVRKVENIWKIIWRKTLEVIRKGFVIIKEPKQSIVQLSIINNSLNNQSKVNCCVSMEDIRMKPGSVKLIAESNCKYSWND